MEPFISLSPESLLLEHGDPRRLRSELRFMSGTKVAWGFSGGGVIERPVSSLSRPSLSSGLVVYGTFKVFKSFSGLNNSSEGPENRD